MNVFDIIGFGQWFAAFLSAISWEWFGAGLIIGSIIGAMFGWLGVIGLVGSFISGVFAGRKGADPSDWIHPDDKPKRRK